MQWDNPTPTCWKKARLRYWATNLRRWQQGVFDVLHGSENSKIFAERVDHACIENYGHAGPVFVEKLMRATDKAGNWRAYVDSFCRVIGKEADVSLSDGQVQRVLKRFALAALAGELATQVGLTGWPKGAARDVA
ncbi:hypothetical protein [Roseovarius sp. D22-M7]|uniref:hypothetical protein n=1 Tax=Roseovarius sp. D22-M7 TaxID=3127116 RepID=UPI00300FA77E